jgi:hypothetical protein
MGQLGQAPDELTNQVHQIINGQPKPVVRTDPKAYMVNDGTNDRVMMGGFGDGNYGIKVSQPGFDVKSATDAQLVMSSGFNSFKIAASGLWTVTNTLSNTANSFSMSHGLGYVPAHLLYLLRSGAYYQLPMTIFVGGSPSITINTVFETSVDANSIFLTIYNVTGQVGSQSCPIRYYLLKETAS